MESKLESDIEERKQPLLGSPVPPLNFETLKPEDEPLRQQVDEGGTVTFRGDEVEKPLTPMVESSMVFEQKVTFNADQLNAINGLKQYHFTPKDKLWQHKIFLRKHFNTLSQAQALPKDLEIEKEDIQDIAFGDSQLALEILQREAEHQDMRKESEAEIRDAMQHWFTKKEVAPKMEIKPVEAEGPPSNYSQSDINVQEMWERAVEHDNDKRALKQAKKKKRVIPRDTNLEKFGQVFQEQRSMTIQQSNEWILKNQGQDKAIQILEDKFYEKMLTYDKFKRQFACKKSDDFEMVSCQGQVQYLMKVNSNQKLQLEHYRFNQLVKVLTLNDDIAQADSSFISFQQCGSYIYFFKVKTVEEDQIQETQPTDITQAPQFNRPGKSIKKVVLNLCCYDMSLDSEQEPEILQKYEAPMKFDTQNGQQMIPIAVMFVNNQTSQFSQTKQNWPKGVPGNDCQKFLESMVMAIVYQNPDNQSYRLSFRSINTLKFMENELFYTQKSFPLNKRLQILVAKKTLNKQLPANQVLMVFCGGKGYYAFSTETMLCMGAGGGIGTYISKFIDLEAFKPQNKTLQNLLNKVSVNQIKFYGSCLYILDEKNDICKIKNVDVIEKLWRLTDKLLQQNSNQMPEISAFYDVVQDTLTIVLTQQKSSPLELILINRKTNKQLIAESLRDQMNCYGFVPPHLRVIQLKHFTAPQTNFIEDKDTFIQASYQFTNLIRDNNVVYLQYKVEGDPVVKEFVDQEFALKFLNSPILHQDKTFREGTWFGSNGHVTNFVSNESKYQIGWKKDKFEIMTDCQLSSCSRVTMEKILFQEDDRYERPIVAIRESQFGKIESMWFMTLNLETRELKNQIEIGIEKQDLENVNEVFLSASSEVDEETSSQNFQVCLQMITNQIKIIEFKVYWTPNNSKKTYDTKIDLIGQKWVTQKKQNFGEILFFGPLFKQNYEVVGTQIIQRDNNQLSYLNLENLKEHEYQFQNEFADIGYIQDSQVLIIDLLFSKKLQLEKNIIIQDMLEIGEQMINASFIIKPFKVHEYLLTQDQNLQFFTNQELLNGYSVADFCLNDHVLMKEKIQERMSEKRDNLLSIEMQEFDPIFEKTIHLTSLLERCIQNPQFEDSKMALMNPMLQECNELSLNSTKYLILLENIDIIILSNCKNFQKKLLSSECSIDLSPLQLKRKLNSLYNLSKVESFTSKDLAQNLQNQKLEMCDLIKLALIDQQWTMAQKFYKAQLLAYVMGYFVPFYYSKYNDGYLGGFCGRVCLLSSFLFLGGSIVAMKQGLVTWQKVTDAVFFLLYPLYYILDKQRKNVQSLIEDPNQLTEEVLSKGFFEILTVLLIIHSLVKFGELTQSIDIFRRTYLTVRKCMVDAFKLSIILGIVIGVFGVINQVLSPSKIELGESVVQVYDQSFSFEFMENSENSTQVRNFCLVIRLFQQFIFPIIMINLVFTTMSQSYDLALSLDFEHYHLFKASINLEFFAFLRLFGELPPLERINFQVSQDLAAQITKSKSEWHGFVMTLKNFIQSERQATDQIVWQLNAKMEGVERVLDKAVNKRMPEVTGEAMVKINGLVQDMARVKTIVKEMQDKQIQKESEKEQIKLQKTTTAQSSWLGAFGPRPSVVSTTQNEATSKINTPVKGDRVDSHSSPVRTQASARQAPNTTEASARKTQITSRYKDRDTFASPMRSVRK